MSELEMGVPVLIVAIHEDGTVTEGPESWANH